jgi:hypothetical protein
MLREISEAELAPAMAVNTRPTAARRVVCAAAIGPLIEHREGDAPASDSALDCRVRHANG